MLRFDLIDSLSLPSDAAKPNEDAFGLLPSAAVVLDGATGLGEQLMPGRSDAAWLAQFGARRLLAHLGNGNAPRDALRRAMEDAEKSFAALRRRPPAERYESPFASMMLLCASENEIEALWFGDCAALIKPPGEPVMLLGDTLAKRELEAARVARLAATHNLAPASGHDRPEFLSALRRARNSVNTEKGGWLFGPDASAAEHASHRKLSVAENSVVLLASDGFLAMVSDYRAYDPEALLAAVTIKGLPELGHELREIEDADPDGARHPRFKKSDDATAVLLRIASC